MSVRIRLTRTGRTNLPSYRIGVFDARTRRDGPAKEIIGWYNPLSREAGKGFRVDEGRLEAWMNDGALMTLPVRSLLRRQGVALAQVKAPAKPALKGKKAAPKKAKAMPAAAKDRHLRKKARKATRVAAGAKRKAAAKAAGKKE